MKKNEEVTLSQNSQLYEMKLNQTDLIDYVISCELERINVFILPLEEAKKKTNEDIKKYEKELAKVVTEFGKKILASHLKLLKGTLQFKLLPIRDTNNRQGDLMYAAERDMSAMFGFLYANGPYGRAWGREGHEDKYVLETPNNMLICMDKETMVAAFRFEIPAADFKKLKDDGEKLKNTLSDLSKQWEKLDNEKHNVKSNSTAVKNRLTEQFLNGSEEGKKLLEQLQKISLTNNKMLAPASNTPVLKVAKKS